MAKKSLTTEGNAVLPLRDGQFEVASIDRKNDKTLVTVSKSKKEPVRKRTTGKIPERKVEGSHVQITGGSKSHGNSKLTRRPRKMSHLDDCGNPLNNLKQTYPKKGRDILAESEESVLEDSYYTSSKIHVENTRAKPAAITRERILGRSLTLPPLQDTLTASSSLMSAAKPLTPNSALLMQKLAVSPSVAQAEFSFDDDTRQRKRHGKLPPISALPQREPTLVVVPPTPTSKKPSAFFLPKLNPIRSQLSSASSTSSNGEQSQFLSKSAPANCDERCALSAPINSSKSLEFSFPTSRTPSHLSYHSSTLSDSSLSSLNSQSSPSSSALKYDGDVDEVFVYYPLPPPTPSEKSRNQRRRRPGCRLVPFNKVDSRPLKLDSTTDDFEDIQEVQSCSRKSSKSESETSDEENAILKEYLRICPGRRGAICDKLEKNMNVVKINGKKYNLTTLRHELTEMINAVKKYDMFFKTFKFFR